MDIFAVTKTSLIDLNDANRFN